MFRFLNLNQLGFACFGGAKRLTRGYPVGDFIELGGDYYDEA